MADFPGIYGPSLPPHLTSKKDETKTENAELLVEDQTYGPVLPPCLKVESPSKKDVKISEDENKSPNANPGIYGPALPPNLSKGSEIGTKESYVYGPTLPPQTTANTTGLARNEIGSDDETEGNVIGPLPPSGNDQEISVLEAEMNRRYIESRSLAMKDKLTGKKGEEKLEREEWMIELPPEMNKNFGLGPRTFRAKTLDLGDRSGWTETPKDKAKKKDMKEEPKMINKPEISKSEIALKKEVEEYNKAKRPVSLMELHQQNLKKQKLGDGPSIRRPFDRDTDLSSSKNDPKAKAKFLKNSQKMADKFQTGQFENKFL